MEIYLESYCNHVVDHEDLSNFQETMSNVFKILEFIYKSGNTSLRGAVEEAHLDMDDLDDDEKGAVAVQIIDDFDATVDSIAAAYAVIIQVFKADSSPEIISQILAAAKMMMHEGVESDYGILSTMQGIGLISDFAQFTSAEICMQVFPDMIPTWIQFVEQKSDEWQLIQVIYYAVSSFVQLTQCVEVAANEDLTSLAVKLLESALENGSEDALNCYDNICGFLIKSGHCAKQGAAFWGSLLEACTKMNSDGEEVAHCIRYLANHFESNEAL